MMNNMILKNLPQKPAIQYFSEVLKCGGIKDTTFLEAQLIEGDFHAIAPNTISEERLIEFEFGGILPSDVEVVEGQYRIQTVPNTASHAALLVSNELLSIDGTTFWIHEPLLREEEIIAKRLPYKEIGGQLYLIFIEEAKTSAQELIRGSVLSWHFLGIVTSGLNEVQSIEHLIQHATLILVGAYDGESFLCWKRLKENCASRGGREE